MQGMTTEQTDSQLEDMLDMRGPFIPNQDLDAVLNKDTSNSALHDFASGVLAARMAAS